jgi:hypothetical protein
VFARLFSFSRPANLSDSWLRIVVEFVLLDGAQKSDKAELIVGPIDDEAETHRQLKAALVNHLNAVFPAAGYIRKDVVLWGK